MDGQKTIFLLGEADAYFHRNAQQNAHEHAAALQDPCHDPIIRALIEIKPQRILEVGASNGWRLDVARQLWHTKAHGIDPSRAAVADGNTRYPSIALQVGTADALPAALFDCVVFGFCLYLCDRPDLFRIAAEADRVLAGGGHLVVYDFFPTAPHCNPYVHRPGIFSYKMDYAALWRWHPSYSVWRHEVIAKSGEDPMDPNRRLAVTVLRKF
jgi:SAM-dependent methyltransferase